MKTFVEVVADYLRNSATLQEVLQIRTVLDDLEGRKTVPHYTASNDYSTFGDSEGIYAEISQLLQVARNQYVTTSYNSLSTVKFIKDKTGWGLKESKNWFDWNVRGYRPYPANMDIK